MTTRRITGESGALLAGSVVNGVFAYVFVAIGTRAVGADGFAPVAVLWTFWALSSAVLTFPLQHWVIRQMAVDGNAAGVRAALGRITAWTVSVVSALTLVAVSFRDPLFGQQASWWWPVLVAGTAIGSGYLGMVRGLLAGSGRYGAAAAVIGGENVVRVAAVIVGAALSVDATGIGIALLFGPLVGLLWPSSLRMPDQPAAAPAAGALLGSAGMSLLLAQVVLNGGPPLLAALGGSEAEVTALFAALALFRAPYLLALGLTVRITAPLTRLVEDGRLGELARMARLTTLATLACAGAAAAAGWAAGPTVIRVLFGEGTDPTAGVAAAVAAGCTLALGALGLTVALIARAGVTALSASWALAVGAGAIVLVTSLPAIQRVVSAFVVSEVVAVAAMAVSMEWWLSRVR
jgi:O-antigen/teichoic acid export membrane protein